MTASPGSDARERLIAAMADAIRDADADNLYNARTGALTAASDAELAHAVLDALLAHRDLVLEELGLEKLVPRVLARISYTATREHPLWRETTP